MNRILILFNRFTALLNSFNGRKDRNRLVLKKDDSYDGMASGTISRCSSPEPIKEVRLTVLSVQLWSKDSNFQSPADYSGIWASAFPSHWHVNTENEACHADGALEASRAPIFDKKPRKQSGQPQHDSIKKFSTAEKAQAQRQHQRKQADQRKIAFVFFRHDWEEHQRSHTA